jgi:membrane-associated phospholipid phosphatase
VHAVVPTADTWLHALVLRSRGPADLSLARTLTQAGSTRLVWPVIAVAAMAFPRSAGARRWVEAAAVVAGAGAAIGVRLAFSVLVHRGRPPQGDWTTYAGGFAFPSGHTTAATVGVGLLAWAVTRHLSHRQARVAAWAAVVVCAGTVGWTRVWLGVHWPSDVAGGWLLGAGWLAGMAAVTCWLEASSRRPDHDQSTSDAAGTPAADRPGDRTAAPDLPAQARDRVDGCSPVDRAEQE